MRLVLIFLTLMISFLSHAEQCLSTVSKNKEFINQPNNNKLTRIQEQSVNRLFQELSRSWIGTVSGFYCVGEEIGNTRKVYKAFDLELEFNNDVPLILRSRTKLDDKDEYTQRLSSLNIFADQGYLRFDQNNQLGDIWIDKLSSTHLNVWYLSRAGTVYHLINREIKRSPGAFTINVKTYSNKRLTSVYTGRLSY